MKTLTNGTVSITVEDHGAELSSIRRGEREYLWGAYPEFWKRHSPVLFPIVGSVWNGEYRSHGKTYKLGQHGIARDMDFKLVKEEEDYVEYELCSSEETLEKYPYAFVLRIGYKLHDNSVDVIWKVENPADEEMYFQIGAHPAFYWPMLSNEVIGRGVEAMNEELAKSELRGCFKLSYANGPIKDEQFGDDELIRLEVIKEKGCIDSAIADYIAIENGTLWLNTESFDDDALILPNSQVNGVTLCDDDENPYLTLTFDAPLVGLWSPPKKNAPFVCIEPWYGRTDRMGYEGTYEEKDWMERLEAHGKFEVKYTITLH